MTFLQTDPLTGKPMEYQPPERRCKTPPQLLDLILQARIEANYAEINPSGGHMMNLRLLLNDLEAEAKKLPLAELAELSLWGGANEMSDAITIFTIKIETEREGDPEVIEEILSLMRKRVKRLTAASWEQTWVRRPRFSMELPKRDAGA